MKRKIVNVNQSRPTMAESESAVLPSDDNIILYCYASDENLLKDIKEMFSNADQDIITTTLNPMAASQSPERPANQIPSPAPSSSYKSTAEHTLYSSTSAASSSSKENITLVVSPVDILDNEIITGITTLDPMAASQSSERPANRISSPVPSPSYKSTAENTVYSSLSFASSSSKENTTLVVSPEDVFSKHVHLKRKREQKPELETGICAPPKPKKAKKIKVYEIDQPFEDTEMERKRLNAVKAKRHRDLQRQNKEAMEQQLEDVKDERDGLKKENEDVKNERDGLKKENDTLRETKVSLTPQQLEDVENERDGLKKEVDTLRETNVSLTQQLEVFKKRFHNLEKCLFNPL